MEVIAYTLIAVLKDENEINIVQFNYQDEATAMAVALRIRAKYEDSSTNVEWTWILKTIVDYNNVLLRKEHTEIAGELIF